MEALRGGLLHRAGLPGTRENFALILTPVHFIGMVLLSL